MLRRLGNGDNTNLQLLTRKYLTNNQILIHVLKSLYSKAAVAILVEYGQKLKRDRHFDVIVTHSAPWTHRVIQAFFTTDELPPKCDSMPIEHALFDQQLQVLQATDSLSVITLNHI